MTSHADGLGAPESFDELGISAETIRTLAERDVTTPFTIQQMVIPDVLAGKDVLAKSRTGSGKTLAFAAPIVDSISPSDAKPSALILVPTRELAVQVTGEFKDIAEVKDLWVAEVYGGTSIKEQSRRAAKAHILVATPGRLLDLARRKAFTLDKIKILVLDEADRMLDMGFQPQVDEIVDLLPTERQTMFFSATLDGHVGFLAGHYTKDPERHEVVSKLQTVDEVEHRFVKAERSNKVDRLIESISDTGGLTLVFVRTKRGADRLGYRLRNKGVDAVVMHGDLTQAQREKALAHFDQGRVKVLIATDVAARGLDLDEISHVVNYDPPDDDKTYVHRVGRTARAGRSGIGITLVTPDEEIDVGRMADRLGLRSAYEAGGMVVAPPRVVFSSHGRRSNLRPPRSRRL